MKKDQLSSDVERFLNEGLLSDSILEKDLIKSSENLGDLLIKEDKTKGNLVVISSFIKTKHPSVYIEFYEELMMKNFLRHERSFNIIFLHTIFGIESFDLSKVNNSKPTFFYFTDVKDSNILEFIQKVESLGCHKYLAFSEMPSVIDNVRYYEGRPEWFIHINKADLFKKFSNK